MARALILYETYTRQDVHDIFEPGTRFAPQAGTWGLWGIVPVPGQAGDFVFFVTFGKEQAGHHFDEWVSRNGVINWQSQPRQNLADRQIQQFIQHDPTKNNIYLFLRTKKTMPYTYLGRLAYHTHDPILERPVYIRWQILDWNLPLAHLQAMGLTLRVEEPQPAPQSADTAFFEWRGVQYPVDLRLLRSIVRHHIRAGLPAEAVRFRDWYVELEGNHLSAKWIFHLLTNADYSEFDAPTARDKLEKVGIQAYPVQQVKETSQGMQYSIFSSGDSSIVKPVETELSEQKMYRSKFYKPKTIRAMTNLIMDLAHFGEVNLEGITRMGLNDYHILQLMQSGWAISTPYAFVATPRMLNALPIPDWETLKDKLHLTAWDTHGWATFDQKVFHLPLNQRFPQLSFDYIYTPKSTDLTRDTIWRPIWLVNYLPEEDWDDWEVTNLMHASPEQREAKLYVHSAIPIQNVYGGIAEAQEAVWKSAFYWLMLQLIILSDPETGSVYDPQISVNLSDGWRDDSAARLFLQGEYIGELADCLPDLMAPFKWVWVNRSNSASDNNQACLGLLRLLLKIEIAELAKDGRLMFTDTYRRQLFENQAKARLQYLHSKEARDKMRETIKEMAG